MIDGRLCLETAAGFVKVVLVLLHRTSCRIWKSYVLRSSLDSRRCLHCSLNQFSCYCFRDSPPELHFVSRFLNPLNAELNPICYLVSLLAHRFLHVSTIRVKSLTLRLLSYIYIYIYTYIYIHTHTHMEHLFLMFLDHTRRTTVGRTPLDE